MTVRQSMAEGKLTTQLTDIADRAMCSWMDIPGAQEAVPWIIAGNMAIPNPISKAAGVGLLALQVGCNFLNEPSPGGSQIEGSYQRSCNCLTEVRGYHPNDPNTPRYDADYWNFEFLGLESIQDPNFEEFVTLRLLYKGAWGDIPCEDEMPATWDTLGTINKNDVSGYRLTFNNATPNCNGPDGPMPQPDGPPPDLPNFTGTTVDNSCNVQATLKAYTTGKGGQAVPIINMRNLGPVGGTRTPGGGIIGGCNWDGDLVYVGGDGDGPPTIGPYPPDWQPEEPWRPDWPYWLTDFLTGLGANIIGDVIDELNDPETEPGEWFMQAPCNIDPETGEPQELRVQFPAAKLNMATIQRVNAIPEFLGQHLAWRTPICNEQPTQEGNWISIEFESDEISPMGTTRLRKRFRYRSKSGRELGELIDYWHDFTWDAGPVCLKHTGAWWGTPQCWASSATAGKRLIYHAAHEAGLDPDQVGKWEVSGSNNPRYGMPGTMRIRQNKGTFCITNRLGSDGLPEVGMV